VKQRTVVTTVHVMSLCPELHASRATDDVVFHSVEQLNSHIMLSQQHNQYDKTSELDRVCLKVLF